MVPRMLAVMRMLRKTQPRITVKSLYFGGLFDSALNAVSIGLAPVNPRRDNAGPFELQHAAVLLFCALPNMETKKNGYFAHLSAVSAPTHRRPSNSRSSLSGSERIMKNPLAIFREAGSAMPRRRRTVVADDRAGLRVLSADRPNCIGAP